MLPVIVMVVIAVMSVAVALYTAVVASRRRTVLERAVEGGAAWGDRSAIIATTAAAPSESLLTKIGRSLPTSWTDDAAIQHKLVQAGYESNTAPLTYAALRVACLIVIPGLTLLAFPGPILSMMMYGLGSAAIALVIPRGMLDRRVRQRQERIRRSLPDALARMVLCVEAGESLDAAIVRVAKELQIAHPELAYEYAVVNRKTNAGVTREEALRGLWERTGVDDIKSLVSSMIQSEKWGTSIARVLRVAAETLRRKRRQAAEKRAALAPLKMTIPLVTLILPAMFIVILGPVALKMIETFRQ